MCLRSMLDKVLLRRSTRDVLKNLASHTVQRCR